MLQEISTLPSEMAAKAGQAAALMKALSNEHRLLILCHLIGAGELSVGELVRQIGLSQSALSQHLAKLREEGLVGFRRESQTLFYHVSDPRAGQLLELLRDLFCPELKAAGSGMSRMASAPAAANARPKGD